MGHIQLNSACRAIRVKLQFNRIGECIEDCIVPLTQIYRYCFSDCIYKHRLSNTLTDTINVLGWRRGVIKSWFTLKFNLNVQMTNQPSTLNELLITVFHSLKNHWSFKKLRKCCFYNNIKLINARTFGRKNKIIYLV